MKGSSSTTRSSNIQESELPFTSAPSLGARRRLHLGLLCSLVSGDAQGSHFIQAESGSVEYRPE